MPRIRRQRTQPVTKRYVAPKFHGTSPIKVKPKRKHGPPAFNESHEVVMYAKMPKSKSSFSKPSTRQSKERRDGSKPSTAQSNVSRGNIIIAPLQMSKSEKQHNNIKNSRLKTFKMKASVNSPLNAPPNTVRRIKSREKAMATPAPTNVCPVIIKPKAPEKVEKYRGHDDKFKKKLSTKDKAMKASRRLVTLKDLLKLKILNSSETRALMRQDYYTFGKAFKKMDTNGDGVVDYNELAAALGPNGMNIGLKEGELYHLAREFDHDGNGSIDIEEFFHTLADLDAPDKNLTLILAESKKLELETYIKKLAQIKKLNMKKFNAKNTSPFSHHVSDSENNSSGRTALDLSSRLSDVEIAGPSTSPIRTSRSTGRLRRARRMNNHGSVSLPALHSSRLLDTSKFVTGEGHSNPEELEFSNKKLREEAKKKIWPVRKKVHQLSTVAEQAGEVYDHETQNHASKQEKILRDVSTNKRYQLHGIEKFYPGAISGKRMYRDCKTLNSQFHIELPDAPPTMESWKRTSTPTWKKGHVSKRKGAEVFIPILKERYAKRDDESYKKYQSRIKGRVKSRYNYMIGLFENEMALESLAARGNKKGGLGSPISKWQQRGQLGHRIGGD
eukprot:g6149.t1